MNTNQNLVLCVQHKQLPAPKHLPEISVNLMEQEVLSLIERVWHNYSLGKRLPVILLSQILHTEIMSILGSQSDKERFQALGYHHLRYRAVPVFPKNNLSAVKQSLHNILEIYRICFPGSRLQHVSLTSTSSNIPRHI